MQSLNNLTFQCKPVSRSLCHLLQEDQRARQRAAQQLRCR